MRVLPNVRPVRVAVACALAMAISSCSDGDDDAAAPSTDSSSAAASAVPTGSVAGAGRCLVRLHGKGGSGATTVTEGDVTILAPTGNADGWGARQWLYFPDDEFDTARAIVTEAVAGCDEIIVNGFSNGAAFAAKLYCQGETFDGRLVRVVVDDPVVDGGVQGCAPDAAVGITLYWTGALDATAQPGWDCAEADWTCEGGTTIGIDAYAAALATEVVDSPHDDHQWYLDVPEVGEW